MTRQEYKELLIQCARDGTFPSYEESLGGKKICRYRGPGNKKCAAGVLIPDDKYTSEMEGRGIFASFVEKSIQVPEGMLVEDLFYVQQIHDNLVHAWDPKVFIEEIEKLPFFKGV